MSAPSGHGSDPDLTPMLDMVFQLVTFFMLVTSFKSAALDLTLTLPVAGSARPVESGGKDKLLILNITPNGQLSLYGRAVDVESYIDGESQVSRMTARREGTEIAVGGDLPEIVVVRADRTTPFSMVNKVITSCQKHGYRSFAMRAMNKEGGQ
jgi:biopolymer transport protein ExbD